MSVSEVAHIRQQIAAEEQSAFLGLHGSAVVASHESIIERMEQAGLVYLQMIKEGRGSEAIHLMNNGWNVSSSSTSMKG